VRGEQRSRQTKLSSVRKQCDVKIGTQRERRWRLEAEARHADSGSWETEGGRTRSEVGSGTGFILAVVHVDAWREIVSGSDARKGGRQPITRSGPPRFLMQNHRHAHYYTKQFKA
jgi:hypothetical protein